MNNYSSIIMILQSVTLYVASEAEKGKRCSFTDIILDGIT